MTGSAGFGILYLILVLRFDISHNIFARQSNLNVFLIVSRLFLIFVHSDELHENKSNQSDHHHMHQSNGPPMNRMHFDGQNSMLMNMPPPRGMHRFNPTPNQHIQENIHRMNFVPPPPPPPQTSGYPHRMSQPRYRPQW